MTEQDTMGLEDSGGSNAYKRIRKGDLVAEQRRVACGKLPVLCVVVDLEWKCLENK